MVSWNSNELNEANFCPKFDVLVNPFKLSRKGLARETFDNVVAQLGIDAPNFAHAILIWTFFSAAALARLGFNWTVPGD